VKSKSVKLLMAEELKITQQPQNRQSIAKEGETTYVSVEVSGKAPYTFRWYRKLQGESSFKKVAETKASKSFSNQYYISLTEENHGAQYYCVIEDTYGQKVKSETGTLEIVGEMVITKQPESQSVKVGDRYTFTVEVSGPGEKSYRWYRRVYLSSYWNVYSTSSTASGILKNPNSYNGYYEEFYCVITNGCGDEVTTETVRVSVK